MFVCVLCAFFLFLQSQVRQAADLIKGLMRTYHWISLFMSHKVSKLAYRIWVILIANRKSYKKKKELKLNSRYNWQSASQYVLVSSPLWDLRPDINSVWKLLSSFCGTPSLTRGRVCLLSVTFSSIYPLSSYFLHRGYIFQQLFSFVIVTFAAVPGKLPFSTKPFLINGLCELFTSWPLPSNGFIRHR
jgi:hypothetical protein